MHTFELRPIGTVKIDGDGYRIEVKPEYRPALSGTEGFSHLVVLFWCDRVDTPELRAMVDTPKPYRNAPDTLGLFATRSPVRPNPIAVSALPVTDIDRDAGIVKLGYIDAEPDTPVLDIKPYHPCSDIVRDARVPSWCDHWPKCQEDGMTFDWGSEFLFNSDPAEAT